MIAETILNYAKEAGLEEAEVYQSQTQTLHFDILDGQPRQFVVSDKSGLSLRGTRQGRCASAYTEKTDEGVIADFGNSMPPAGRRFGNRRHCAVNAGTDADERRPAAMIRSPAERSATRSNS